MGSAKRLEGSLQKSYDGREVYRLLNMQKACTSSQKPCIEERMKEQVNKVMELIGEAKTAERRHPALFRWMSTTPLCPVKKPAGAVSKGTMTELKRKLEV